MLSISVLSIFDTNQVKIFYLLLPVVICFQFQFFLSLIPTGGKQNKPSIRLWFAFNFSSFYLWYQQNTSTKNKSQCCDLLSISVLSIFDTNYDTYRMSKLYVVICFQFQFFLSLIPTRDPKIGQVGLLWFAFNFSSFYLWYQLIKKTQTMKSSCDLLSISVLSIFDTNKP